MARETWINNDGLEVGFGPTGGQPIYAGGNHIKGKIKQMEMRVDVANGYPTVGTAMSAKNCSLPAGAYIVGARYIAEVDFDAAVEFGTAQVDGTAINQNGLIATGTTTAEGAGVQVETVLGEVAYLTITETTAAPTVGEGTLVVEYII